MQTAKRRKLSSPRSMHPENGALSNTHCQRPNGVGGANAVQGREMHGQTGADCRRSEQWKGLVGNAKGVCIAQARTDCEQSNACKIRDDAVLMDADIAWSLQMRTVNIQRLCSASQGHCVAQSEADCRTSIGCRENGQCHWNERDSCIAHSSADCKASEACKVHGRCVLRQRRCVMPPRTEHSPTR